MIENYNYFSNGDDPETADVLAAAVIVGDPEIVRAAIERGVDIDAVGQSGAPPVVLAAVHGREELVEMLLEAGAEVNLPDSEGGMTALHAAIIHGRASIVRRLIAGGADVNASFGRPPMTALAHAFRRGEEKLVRSLLEAGADPNVVITSASDPVEQQGTTPIHYASSVGDLAMLRLLLQHRANPDAIKADGLTPSMIAAFNGRLDVLRILVEAGAHPGEVVEVGSSKRPSALDIAAAMGHGKIVKYLNKISNQSK